jgi:hypothetical protein
MTSHKTLPWESKGPLSKMAPFLDDIAARTPFSWYSHNDEPETQG